MIPLRTYVDSENYFVVAHRGSSGTAPENTMAALERAISDGANMVEIDVQFTNDNEAIVFHDSVLGRTSSGNGKVQLKRFAELQHLDAGSWFAAEFTGQHIPRLTEALDFLKNKAYVNIEIKTPAENTGQQVAQRIAALIDQLGMTPYCLFSSFHLETLTLLKSINPNVHTAAIKHPNDTRLPSELAAATGCEAFVCSVREFSVARAADAAQAGLYCGVYTVNDEENLSHVLARGAKAIVTNFPGRIVQIMRSLRLQPFSQL